MSIRTPDDDIEIPSLAGIDPVLQWHSLSCELVTPMYGGGVKSTVVDEQMPIRASSIRGQLRFWWRLLAKNHPKFMLDNKVTRTPEQIRQAEFKLWGGMGSGEDEGVAGQVFIRVSQVPSPSKIRQSLIDHDDSSLAKIRYVLFPAYNETDPALTPHRLLKAEGITWQLEFAFSPQLALDEQRQNQVVETLRWWASFGGLGFRSRKGLGAIRVTESEDYPQIAQVPSADEVAAANCHLIQRSPTPDAMGALQSAIGKLSEFRQAPGVGRNPGQQKNRPGRSRWPEPDALRRIQNTHNSDHAPEHPAGNVFARAVFGLPIIFHFVGHKEPSDTNLLPTQGERLASPLILRPVYAGEDQKGNPQWRPTAFVLPYQHILDMEVKVGDRRYPIWTESTAQDIRPIAENGGQDPMQAFLTYFAK